MYPIPPVTARTEPAVSAAPDAVPSPEQRTLTQEVSKAVKQLNDAGYAGKSNEITFSIDRVTRLPVVKVVNISTNEVLNQWPAQYLLQLAATYEEQTRDSK
jgi:uncharacterized FlaG/YvyC family protein